MKKFFYLSLASAFLLTAMPAFAAKLPPPDGALLYGTHCSGCHGDLANSTKGKATLARINKGVRFEPDMAGLKSPTLKAAELKAIAKSLLPVTPAAPNGTAVYNKKCAPCHGTLDQSTVVDRSLKGIQTAIKKKKAMRTLSYLQVPTLQAVSGALAGITPPPPPPPPPGSNTEGVVLYYFYKKCVHCHGPISKTKIKGATTTRIQGAINSQPKMAYLNTLTAAQIKALSDALISGAEPNSDTYNRSDCIECHNPDGTIKRK